MVLPQAGYCFNSLNLYNNSLGKELLFCATDEEETERSPERLGAMYMAPFAVCKAKHTRNK